MRLLVPAALCLFALPAAAQRVDTRVIDIKRLPDGLTTCRLNAIPDMLMTQGVRAVWTHRARDGAATLHATFLPAGPGERNQTIDSITIPESRALGPVTHALVSLDADDSPVSFQTTRRGGKILVVPADGARLAEAMRYTDLLTIRLFDRRNARVASYEFWIGDLQNVAEVPEIIGWRCRNY